MKEKIEEFDVVVIGAGPAGLISAGKAGESGVKVLLLEKNEKPGKKFLLTGKGRCNITNTEFNLRKLTEKYGNNGKFLFHAFSVFGPKQVIDFFEKLKIKTKIERGGRVFPMNNKAENILRILIKYLLENKVKIACNSEVVKIVTKDSEIRKIIVKINKEKKEIRAKNYIFCTGGMSYPSTGSNGNGFDWAKSFGHKIIEPSPALVPIKIKEKWLKELQGLSLKNVKISAKTNNKNEFSEFGECLFTHFGMSGPVILNISKRINALLKNKKNVKISIDLKPALNFEKLDERIQRDFKKNQNKLFRNCLNDLLPHKIIPIILELSGINLEKKVNSITKKERHNLIKLLKNFEITPTDVMGFDFAIITSGGIALKEINDKTMKSKIINNLFFAGEIIDIDGPTGGYNLQNCWSTGYLAGKNSAIGIE